nr:pejvakin [Lethenteron camtschaticum]
MFAAATKNFVTQVGSNGRLVPVPSLNEADRYHPLSLVTKKRRSWLWQKAKYSSTSFALKDILVGEKDIDIGAADVTSYQLVNYEDESDGAPGRRERHGSEGVLAGVGFSVAHSENVAVHASLGIVTKHELDVPLLLRTQGRASEEGARQGKGRDKTIVIPAHTTVAFSVFDLYIRLDGSFGGCARTHTHDFYEQTATLTDLSGPSGVGASSTSNGGGRGGGFPPEEPGAHQRVNLLHQGVSKGPCALCGLGARPRDTVYGCLECAWGGHKYVRLHAVPCFDLWHRKMKS